MKTRSDIACILTTLVLASVLGCADPGPKLGIVTGTITLSDKPLEGAAVEFHPLFPEGKVAYASAKTDANGFFEMQYSVERKGVLVGAHQVHISTQDWEKQPDGSNKVIPERVPKWYFGPDSILEFDVQEGENTADFDLTKKKPKDWPPK